MTEEERNTISNDTNFDLEFSLKILEDDERDGEDWAAAKVWEERLSSFCESHSEMMDASTFLLRLTGRNYWPTLKSWKACRSFLKILEAFPEKDFSQDEVLAIAKADLEHHCFQCFKQYFLDVPLSELKTHQLFCHMPPRYLKGFLVRLSNIDWL